MNIEDPHESKIPKDDPRVRAKSPAGRTLRKGPAIAVAVLAVCLLFVALIIALSPTAKAPEKKVETAAPVEQAPPIVPDAIRNAPGGLQTPPSQVGPLETHETRAIHASTARDGYGEPDSRAEQRSRASGAGILFDRTRVPDMPVPPPTASFTSSEARSAGITPPIGTSADGANADPNLQARKNAFLDGASRALETLPERVVRPQSPYEVKGGTIIPAVLITGINSDLPGPVIGQVRENVYDTASGNHLLIPQGARLLAQYDSMVAWGQERVLVCWNRLVFPNGDSIRLDCMPAADLAGAAGLADRVNEHWGRMIKGAAVATLLAATTSYGAGNTQGMYPTVMQGWAHGASNEMNQVGQATTRRDMNIQPTITVRPGLSINVIVTKDMVLPAPYGEAPNAKGY